MSAIAPAALFATARDVAARLRAARVDLTDEKRAQVGLAGWLLDAGHTVARERRLGPGDIVDILVDETIAVEVKLNHARRADVLRQLARYARHDEVAAVILATNRAVGIPDTIAGKPAWEVSLGRAWL